MFCPIDIVFVSPFGVEDSEVGQKALRFVLFDVSTNLVPVVPLIFVRQKTVLFFL